MTYEKIKAIFDSRRKDLDYKRMDGRATILHENDMGIALKFHETDVAIFTHNYIELNSGGWLTPTTKERMNEALHLAGVSTRVSQYKKLWYVGGKAFFDGIRVSYQDTLESTTSKVLNPKEIVEKVNLKDVPTKYLDVDDLTLSNDLMEHKPKAQRITQALIDKYLRTMNKQIRDGTISVQFSGTLDDDVDTLVTELKECKPSIAIMTTALEYRGYRWYYFLYNGDSEIDLKHLQDRREMISRAVRGLFEYKLITRLPTSNNESAAGFSNGFAVVH